MKQDELKEIKEILNKIHKTLLYVFWIIAFFALLYFGLLIYLSFLIIKLKLTLIIWRKQCQ